MQKHTLKLETRKDGLATIILNRPDVRNALNDILVQELSDTLMQLETEKSIKVILLASSGPIFSSGADLNWMQAAALMSRQENIEDAKKLSQLLQTLHAFPKPTLVKIQGPAYGGALGLICCCDIAIASENAVFSFSETRIGLAPAVISPYAIAAIGRRAAQRYFLTAEVFDAKKACEIGLIHATTGENELSGNCDTILKTLLANGPLALQKTKQLIKDVADAPFEKATRALTENLIADIRCSEEGREGIKAFLEKRKPLWK